VVVLEVQELKYVGLSPNFPDWSKGGITTTEVMDNFRQYLIKNNIIEYNTEWSFSLSKNKVEFYTDDERTISYDLYIREVE